MNLLTLDFETYWDQKYSLKKMTMVEYIKDPRFKAHMVGLKYGAGEAKVVPGDKIQALFSQLDWSKLAVLAQNTPFDGAILEWIYGCRPAFYLDLKGMSQFLLGKTIRGHSLKEIAKSLKVGKKGKELIQSKGVEILDQAQYDALAGYCGYNDDSDVNLTYRAAQVLMPRMPKIELLLNDWSIKCFTRPQVAMDEGAVTRELLAEKARKKALLKSTGYKVTQIRSNDQFKEILEGLGVEVEMKQGKNKLIPCFAKIDPFMTKLLEHENETISNLAKVRLGLRSTYLEGRLERFKKLAEITDRTPIMMDYSGAVQTARWCVTGDTEICVRRNGEILYISLESLQTADLVWDGEAFVEHGGLVCRGEQEVISYGGITGTRGHKVHVDELNGWATLERAAKNEYHITVAQPPPQGSGA